MSNTKEIQVKKLFKFFNVLQKKYGDKNLDSVYGCGEIKNPDICFVFMNPTGKNISTNKEWEGLKAPWLGTKNIWRMFFQLGFLGKEIFNKIQNKRPGEWDDQFSYEVYREIKRKNLYITNLSKATKLTAENPTNKEFRNYLNLFKKEISEVDPKVIITFGNQVSSVVLGKNISVGKERKKLFLFEAENSTYKVFPVFYPVGQGQRNIEKAKEDLAWITKKYVK